MKNFSKKVISLIIVILLSFSLNPVPNSVVDILDIVHYNQRKGVFAFIPIEPEKEVTICARSEEIDFPYITELRPLTENKLEIPIGRAIEKIESVSEMIIETLPVLIDAAAYEAQASEEMSGLIDQCGKDPYICIPDCICQFDHYDSDSCKCSSSSPGDEYDECTNDSLCGGCPSSCKDCECFGSCPSYKSSHCGSCSPECGVGQECCCKEVEKDCYCKPVFKCEACVCKPKTYPLGSSPCPAGSRTCPGSPGCPVPSGTSTPYPECPANDLTCALTGLTCPLGIDTQLAIIQAQAEIIRNAYEKIADPFKKRFKPIVFYGGKYDYNLENLVAQYYNNGRLGSYIEIPPGLGIPNDPIETLDVASKNFCSAALPPWDELCASPIEIEVEEGLEKSRKRLVDCVLRSGITEEEALKMEYTGLMSCQDILFAETSIYSFLNFRSSHYHFYEIEDFRLARGCFGNTYCRVEEKPGPCAEDYFCCQ